MKKGVKTGLIIIMSILLFTGISYAGFLFYVKNYLKNAPPEAQLKAGEVLYNDCIQEGGNEEECQKYLEAGIGQALIKSKDKFLRNAINQELPAEERVSSLALYNTIMRQDYDYLTDEEIGVYFGLANNKDDLTEIRDMAMIYILEAPSKNKEIINLQTSIMEDEAAKESYRFKAFESVIKYKNPEDIPALINLMKNYRDGGPNIKISNAICWYWPEIKKYIPDLMEDFKNKDNSLATRSDSLNIIECLGKYHGFKDQEIIKELEPFLKPSNHFVIQTSAQSALQELTNKDYKIKEKGEGNAFGIWGVE